MENQLEHGIDTGVNIRFYTVDTEILQHLESMHFLEYKV